MVYPMVILCATIAVAGFLTFFVFPKLVPVFATMNVQLPLTTRILLAVLGFLQSYGIYTLLGVIVLVVAARVIVKQVKGIRRTVDYGLLYVPVLSSVIINVNMVNFTRVFGLLLKSGVKIVEAIEITANTFNNLVYRADSVERERRDE